MSDEPDLIYTVQRIAEHFGKSERTIYRLLRRPEAACFELVPRSNSGGGASAVRAGQANSFSALFELHDAEVSSLRAEAGRRGGLQQMAAPNANLLVTQCSSGGL